MQPKKKPGIDVIDNVLEACYKTFPDALFIQSLMHQYEERGSLSKKQLQGLLLKAKNAEDIPPNWLATLEAAILKMHTRYKSDAPLKSTITPKDERPGKLITEILARYPQHKRVVFLKLKHDGNESLSAADVAELEKFYKLLVK